MADPDRTVELAWRTLAPTWTQDLTYKPDDLWPRIAKLALQWQAEGRTEAEMEAHYEAAKAEYEASLSDYVARLGKTRAGPLPKSERGSGEVYERTQNLMAALLGEQSS